MLVSSYYRPAATPVRTQNVQFQGFIKDKIQQKLQEKALNRDAALQMTKQVLDEAAKRRAFWGRVSDFVDLVPVVGDLVSGAHGTTYVIKGVKEGLPKKDIAKMITWVAADVGLGIVGSSFSWSPPGWALKGADLLIMRSGKRVINIYEKSSNNKVLQDQMEDGWKPALPADKPDLDSPRPGKTPGMPQDNDVPNINFDDLLK